MRLIEASRSAVEKLSKCRSTLGRTSEVTSSGNLSVPKNETSTRSAATLTAWAPGYEGSFAVFPASLDQKLAVLAEAAQPGMYLRETRDTRRKGASGRRRAWKPIFGRLRRRCYEPPEDQQIMW